MEIWRQTALFCSCGKDYPAVAGRCRPCYRAQWRSGRYFGGQREKALARDACCQACGKKSGLCVHHRVPGDQSLPLLIAVCRACHVRVHRRHLLPSGSPPLLLTLWEEQHRGWPVQLSLLGPAAPLEILAQAA